MGHIDGAAKGGENLIRIMKAHAVFGSDNIPEPLGFSYQFTCFIKFCLVGLGNSRCLADDFMGLGDGLPGCPLKLPDIVLCIFNAIQEPCLTLGMAGHT